MGTYLRPCVNYSISDSWQGHKNRNPPSQEPGTDYAAAKDSVVRAATNGVIAEVDHNNCGASGRVVALQADDGNYIRYLHLNSITVTHGQRVTRGQTVGLVGGSAECRDDEHGWHVHVSLWINTTPYQSSFTNTVDFENYIGGPTSQPEPKDITMRGIWNSDNSDENTRRALVGEFSFLVISPSYSTSQWRLFGVENVTQSEWNACKTLVNLRRQAAGMDPLP